MTVSESVRVDQSVQSVLPHYIIILSLPLLHSAQPLSRSAQTSDKSQVFECRMLNNTSYGAEWNRKRKLFVTSTWKTWLRVIPTFGLRSLTLDFIRVVSCPLCSLGILSDIFSDGILSFYLESIWHSFWHYYSICLSGILSRILSGESGSLAYSRHSILSDFLSGILSDIYSGILSGVLF